MSFAIKNALLKLPAQRVLESGYFGIKAAILKPALLILKCSLTPDTSGLPALTITVRNLVFMRLVTGRTGFLMTSIIVSHNFPPPKTEDFLKYYINNKTAKY
jgi:hypothetical protein